MTIITESKVALFFWVLFSVVTIACERGIITAQKPPEDSSQRKDQVLAADTIEIESSVNSEMRSPWKIGSTQASGRQNLDHIYFVEQKHGWAAGEDALYQTVDGGKNWQQLRLDLPAGTKIADISFLNPSMGWVAIQRRASISSYEDNHSSVLQTINGGKTWQQKHEDSASVGTRIVFANEQEGWLIGHRYTGLTPLRFGLWILHTSDQGRNWIDVSKQLNQLAADDTGMVNDELADIILEAPLTVTVLTARGRIFKTSDGGQTWKKIGLISGEPELTYICCFGALQNHWFWLAGGAYEVGKGMWGMLAKEQSGSWKRYRLGSVYFKDVLLLSDRQAFACGSIASNTSHAFNDERSGVILHSSDGGHNWTVLYQNEQIKTIQALTSVDSNNLWAVGEDGLILHMRL